MTDKEMLAFLLDGFASPAMALLHCVPLEIRGEDGYCRVEYFADDQLLIALGTVHGGQICAMLDLVTSFAAVSAVRFDRTLVTLELKTSFLQPVQPGSIIGIGRVRHMGGSIAFLEGELQQPVGHIVATATATARMLSPGV